MIQIIEVSGVLLDGYSLLKQEIQPISLVQGDNYNINTSLFTSDGYALSLTGSAVILTIKPANNVNPNTQPIISREMVITDTINGDGYFIISSDDTSLLINNYYRYDITLIDAIGNISNVVPLSPLSCSLTAYRNGQDVSVPESQQPLAQGPAGPQGLPGYPSITGQEGKLLSNDGTIVEWVDNSTAGNGLTLTGNSFSIDEAFPNTFTATQTFSDHIIIDGYVIETGNAISGQALTYNGAGSYVPTTITTGVSSVSNNDGYVTISPNAGNVVISLAEKLNNASAYSFGNGSIITDAYGFVNSGLSASNLVLTSRTINTTSPITGGASLSSDLTISIPQATTSVDGYLSHTDWNTFNSKGTTGNFTFTGNVADLTSSGVMSIGGTNTTAVQVPGTIQAPTSTDLVLAANGGGNPFVFESSGAHNALFFGAKGFGVTIQADAGGMFISNSGLSTIRLANGWVGSNSDLFESSGFSTNRWTQTWTESVNNTGSVSLISSAADSGTSVAAIIDTSTNWATIGAKLLSVRNDGVEKAFIGFDGSINGLIVNNSYATTSRPSASSVSAGTQIYDTTLTIPVWSDGSNWRNAAGIVS
jgi:hypothetical protein